MLRLNSFIHKTISRHSRSRLSPNIICLCQKLSNIKSFSTSTTVDNNKTSSSNDVPPIDTELESEYLREIEDVKKRQALKKETKQFLTGTVVSDRAAKSIVVQIINKKLFPKYNRFITTQKKVMAHDEEEVCNIGDYVRIIPCRPMSRKKRHKLFEILKKANNL